VAVRRYYCIRSIPYVFELAVSERVLAIVCERALRLTYLRIPFLSFFTFASTCVSNHGSGSVAQYIQFTRPNSVR
jgi:hypothetical protein